MGVDRGSIEIELLSSLLDLPYFESRIFIHANRHTDLPPPPTQLTAAATAAPRLPPPPPPPSQ